jgi:hypothetical protein
LPFLVGGFKHEWIMTFHFIYGNSNPNWLSLHHSSEGLKPTRRWWWLMVWIIQIDKQWQTDTDITWLGL